jgi:hypothetical protein
MPEILFLFAGKDSKPRLFQTRNCGNEIPGGHFSAFDESKLLNPRYKGGISYGRYYVCLVKWVEVAVRAVWEEDAESLLTERFGNFPRI